MNQIARPPRIEPIIDRLHSLHPRLIDLSLDRLQRLLAQLGHPERRLPPIIHVAGTNGKGSTCAMLRAIGEAAGLRVHVYTSPHLVRFNERFRIAGRLVTDEHLADTLEHLEQVNGGAPITVFEAITAAAFHLFAATPADLCILEVGLGGRGDATNVIDHPAASAITSLSLDHRDLLGDTLEAIAAEKAGILKPGTPLITGTQAPEALDVLRARAAGTGSPLLARGESWDLAPTPTGLRYTDAAGTLDLPRPALPGAHQIDNAGIAIAALRAASLGAASLGAASLGAANPGAATPAAATPSIPATAYAGIARATWPARLQRLHGDLAALLPPGWELWLDGGHNPGAGRILADHIASWAANSPHIPLHLVVGMKQAKDTAEFLRPLLPLATTIHAVREPGQHLALPIEDIIAASHGLARPGPTVAATLRRLAAPPAATPAATPGPTPGLTPGPTQAPDARVLVCGSLYLAGEVLKADGTGADA